MLKLKNVLLRLLFVVVVGTEDNVPADVDHDAMKLDTRLVS